MSVSITPTAREPRNRGRLSGTSRAAQFAAADAQDFFAPMLAQVLGKLADAAEARLQKGGPLKGKGWNPGLKMLGVLRARAKASQQTAV